MKMWYLAHQLSNRQAVRKIELRLENDYKINLLNPFYDTGRQDVKDLDTGKIKSRYDFTMQDCKNTVESDLMWIRNSDGVLCILKDGNAIGSFMEIFYASVILDKPVYLICPSAIVRKHLWIRAICFKIFRSIKELEVYFIMNDMVQK